VIPKSKMYHEALKTKSAIPNEHENVSLDPAAAAGPIPRVLFGCSAHSRQKAGGNGSPKTQPNLRTFRDGNSQVAAFSRKYGDHGRSPQIAQIKRRSENLDLSFKRLPDCNRKCWFA
jgi:hypothetical protein